jgi:hypothetical protein
VRQVKSDVNEWGRRGEHRGEHRGNQLASELTPLDEGDSITADDRIAP